MGRKIISIILGGLIISAPLTGCAFLSNTLLEKQNPQTAITSIYDGDPKMWQNIFTQTVDSHFPATPGGVTLPHHMIVANEISRTYQKLAEVSHPSLIVIISPNHYEDGNGLMQTCLSCEYQTTDGNLSIDKSLAKKLVRSNLVTNEPKTFIKEHGVYNHAPFMKHFFPETKILPILLKWETQPEKTVELSNWLDANIPKDALVIASVDFSHYIPVEHANFHDISSYATIKNFDYQNIYDLEVDSPPSISTITHLMEKRGYMSAERFAHTNNQQFQPEPIPETTSHQFIGFFKGEKRPEPSLTIMSFGKIPEYQRHNEDGTLLDFYDSYRWDIHAEKDMMKIDSTKLNPFLRDFRRKEDRMLVGTDFLVFNAPEKDQKATYPCTNKSQNEMKISFCKIETTSAGLANDTQKWILDLKKIKDIEQPSYIYISLNDSKYPISDKNWGEITHNLVDNINNVILVGNHTFKGPRTSAIEQYKKSIIIRSLGDFITPLDIKNASGDIAEITLTPQLIEAKLYSIEIKGGFPQLPFKSPNKNQNIKLLQKG